MKTLKMEGVYPLAFETFDYVAEQMPDFFDKYNARHLHSALGYRSPNQFEDSRSSRGAGSLHLRQAEEEKSAALERRQ